jgi:hypothetical protein
MKNLKNVLCAVIFLTLVITGCRKEKQAAYQDGTEASAGIGSHSGSGASVEAPHFIRTVEFNNKKIPITVYYSREGDYDDGEPYYIIDSITFDYDGKKHTIIPPGDMQSFSLPDNPDDFDRISTADLNFDNYMDIAIFMWSGSGGVWEYIYIYNPKEKKYYYQEELSALATVWADAETQTVKSHGKGGHAGWIYYYKEFKWENGQLILIGSEDQEYDDGLELYLRVTRTLQDGEWIHRAAIIGEDGEPSYIPQD